MTARVDDVTATEAPRSEPDRGYVGALDGLRALAVAAVILYHFAPGVLPGGFLGVDVFFVVSGFLIARLVTGELMRTTTVSLANFWGRRARRLLPALATVVVAVCIAAAISFSATELHDLRAQVIGTLLYVANWVLIAGHGSYFATVGRPSPLRHMWSLAVEEQFYLVFPIVCLLARRWIVRRPVGAAGVALVAAIGSTIWMWVLAAPHQDPSRAYFGSGSHAMGLLVGVALGLLAGARTPWAAIGSRLRASRERELAAGVVALAVLAGVIVTMRVADDFSLWLYRGGFLVFSLACGVVIATVVLIPESHVARILRAPVLVEIGLRSYSLYLWHWPVRVFITPRPGLTGVSLFVVRLAVSVVLAELSFRFVERPFRTGSIAARSGSRGAITYFAVLGVVACVLVTTVAAPGTLPPNELSARGGCPDATARRVDLFGDSTALVFGLAGCKHHTELDLSVGGGARLGCGVVLTDHVSNGRIIPNPHSECDGWQDRWRTSLHRDPNAALVLMTGAWDALDQTSPDGIVKFGTPQWTDLVRSSLHDALSVLTADGRTVYLFDVPCYGQGDPTYPIPERADPRRIDALNAIFADVARTTPHVQIVPWRTLVCPGGKRVEEIDGVRVWQPDEVHLTDGGGRLVWKWLLPRLGSQR